MKFKQKILFLLISFFTINGFSSEVLKNISGESLGVANHDFTLNSIMQDQDGDGVSDISITYTKGQGDLSSYVSLLSSKTGKLQTAVTNPDWKWVGWETSPFALWRIQQGDKTAFINRNGSLDIFEKLEYLETRSSSRITIDQVIKTPDFNQDQVEDYLVISQRPSNNRIISEISLLSGKDFRFKKTDVFPISLEKEEMQPFPSTMKVFTSEGKVYIAITLGGSDHAQMLLLSTEKKEGPRWSLKVPNRLLKPQIIDYQKGVTTVFFGLFNENTESEEEFLLRKYQVKNNEVLQEYKLPKNNFSNIKTQLLSNDYGDYSQTILLQVSHICAFGPSEHKRYDLIRRSDLSLIKSFFITDSAFARKASIKDQPGYSRFLRYDDINKDGFDDFLIVDSNVISILSGDFNSKDSSERNVQKCN